MGRSTTSIKKKLKELNTKKSQNVLVSINTIWLAIAAIYAQDTVV